MLEKDYKLQIETVKSKKNLRGERWEKNLTYHLSAYADLFSAECFVLSSSIPADGVHYFLLRDYFHRLMYLTDAVFFPSDIQIHFPFHHIIPSYNPILSCLVFLVCKQVLANPIQLMDLHDFFFLNSFYNIPLQC